MTREEALERLTNNSKLYPGCAWNCEALELAVEVPERAEKYRLHDLRKDPNDLPDDCRQVLVLVNCAYGETPYVSHYAGSWPTYLGGEVIAWREIEEGE